MLLATILLMCPLPQLGDVAKTETERPAAVSEASNDSTPAKSLPAAPEAKIKTDAEITKDASSGSGNSSAAVVEAVPAANPPAAVKAVKPALSREDVSEEQKHEWYALVGVSSGAAVFDAWSTRRAISGGFGTEANPFLKPFAHSNAIYAATQVSPLVMDLIGRKMMTSRHNWMRRLWWLPQMAGTNVSVSSAIHNVSIVH